MNIKKYLKISFGAAVVLATQVSCIHDDNWDAPQIVCNNKFDAPTKTLAEVVALAPPAAGTSTANSTGSPYDIPATGEAIIFDGYVVSSDEQGNFYKTISIQDKPENPTAGISIGIDNSMNYTDFPVGAHVRIKANGMRIRKVNSTVQLGVHNTNSTFAIDRIPKNVIGRFLSGVCNGNGLEIAEIVPTEVTISQLNAADGDKYINTLVTVKNVQFADNVIGQRLVARNPVSGDYDDTDRQIVDASGNTTVIRTDGYFKQISYEIPNNSGDITFVVSKYNANRQNIIRTISDLDLTTELPTKKLLVETFSDLTTNGWTAYNAAGPNQFWKTDNFGRPAPCAVMNGLGGINEDWLISKSISLSNLGDYAKSVYFSFVTDAGYGANDILEVYVTTDTYSGGDPNSLNWVKLNPILDTNLNSFFGTNVPWQSSGNISLDAYLNKDIRIAFKYKNATASPATAWEIDNFIVTASK